MRPARAVAVLLLVLAICGDAVAGGASFTAKIVKFEPEGKNRYRLVMEWPNEKGGWRSVVVHLRHNTTFWRNPPDFISEANYNRCVARLMTHHKRGERFPFGVMGTGLLPVKNKPNEYQSNTLSEMTEYNGRKVCYSFGNPT